MFDVQTVSGARCPTLGGPPGEGDEVWLLHRPEPFGRQ
jgi:hypothetical protein